MPVVRIPLTQDKFVLVDEADIPLLGDWKWYARPCQRRPGRFYAAARDKTRDGTIYMHRIILGAVAGQIADHVNGDGLDNRRANLRFATYSQNAINRPSRNVHGYRGVCRTRQGRWFARVTVSGKTQYSSPCDTAREAAVAYDRMARNYHGAFAVLNFSDGSNSGARAGWC